MHTPVGKGQDDIRHSVADAALLHSDLSVLGDLKATDKTLTHICISFFVHFAQIRFCMPQYDDEPS